MRTMLPRHHDGTLASLAPDSLARQRSDMELSRQRGDPRAARDAPHRRPTSGRGSRVGPAPGVYQDMVFVEDQEDEGEDEDQDEESKLADKEHAAVAHMQGARAEAARGGLQWGTRVDGRLEAHHPPLIPRSPTARSGRGRREANKVPLINDTGYINAKLHGCLKLDIGKLVPRALV